MTMTWAAFAAALNGRRDASGALDALTTAAMPDLQAMLDAIGAGEAGPLLAQSRAADPQRRRTKLAAALDIIDGRVPVNARVTQRALFGRRHNSTAQFFPSGDRVRSALVASLIDSELGGEPERLRTRVATAATGFETALAAERSGRSTGDQAAEMADARRALQYVVQLLVTDLQSR
jgi:hypothetical protein